MLVSVIIPSYNRLNLIVETLDSVISQTYKNWECIIIDDGSTDDIEKKLFHYIKSYPNIQFYKRNRLPRGVSTSRNIGVEKANGNYVFFLDSDDLLDKNCLKNRVDYAIKYPDYDFWVFTMQEFIYKVGDVEKKHNTYPEDESSEAYLKLFITGVNPFSVTSPLWKTSSLKSLHGFNEKLQLWEDPEMHIRAILSGLKFKVDRDSPPDCYYRNNREEKKLLNNNSIYLKKLYQNTYIYYKVVVEQLNRKNPELKNLLVFNMMRFIQKYVIEKKNFRQYVKYFLLLIKHGLINFRESILLMIWFLLYFLNINKIGKWSKNSIRKRMCYLILLIFKK